jgi:hypothetical protein
MKKKKILYVTNYVNKNLISILNKKNSVILLDLSPNGTNDISEKIQQKKIKLILKFKPQIILDDTFLIKNTFTQKNLNNYLINMSLISKVIPNSIYYKILSKSFLGYIENEEFENLNNLKKSLNLIFNLKEKIIFIAYEPFENYKINTQLNILDLISKISEVALNHIKNFEIQNLIRKQYELFFENKIFLDIANIILEKQKKSYVYSSNFKISITEVIKNIFSVIGFKISIIKNRKNFFKIKILKSLNNEFRIAKNSNVLIGNFKLKNKLNYLLLSSKIKNLNNKKHFINSREKKEIFNNSINFSLRNSRVDEIRSMINSIPVNKLS